MFKLKHFEISTSFRTTFPWSIHPCIYPHFSVFKGDDERLLNERTSLARSLVNSSFALNPKTENVHGIYTFFSLPLSLSLSLSLYSPMGFSFVEFVLILSLRIMFSNMFSTREYC